MRLSRFESRALLILLAGVVLSPLVGQAELYHWTDDDGRVHYSNEPRPGSDALGLEPLALESEPTPGTAQGGRRESSTPDVEGAVERGRGLDEAARTEAVRRDRLKRQRIERWVDSQEVGPAEGLEGVWGGPEGEPGSAPAAPVPAPTSYADRERACQRLHGTSCRQHEMWKQSGGNDCSAGPSATDCGPDAEREPAKRRAGENVERPSDEKRRIQGERDRR